MMMIMNSCLSTMIRPLLTSEQNTAPIYKENVQRLDQRRGSQKSNSLMARKIGHYENVIHKLEQ